jgi:MFS family permease
MMMVVPHHVAYLVGQGFDATVAAWAYASLGVFSFLGRLGMGWLSYRLGHVQTLVLSYSFSIIGTMLLLALHDPHNLGLLWCHIVVYGTGYGGRGPLTSAMVTSLYHGKSWGAILGFLEIGAGLGGWLGPWVSGLLFDYTGSYTLSFKLSIGVLGLAIIAAWCAGWRGRSVVAARSVSAIARCRPAARCAREGDRVEIALSRVSGRVDPGFAGGVGGTDEAARARAARQRAQ